MKRNYAAALQDGAQQWLNEFLKDSKFAWKRQLDLVRPYPRNLARAAELLGEKHYMYASLRARQHYFEGKTIAPLRLGPNRALGDKALAEFRASLDWQPNQPHVFIRIGQIYQYMFMMPDSAEWYFKQAAELAPNWVLPLTQLAALHSSDTKQFEKARFYLEEAERLDSNAVDVSYWFAKYFEAINDLAQAEKYYRKSIHLDPENNFHIELGSIFNSTDRFAESQIEFEIAVKIDSTDTQALMLLGISFQNQNKLVDAEHCFRVVSKIDTTSAAAHFYLGLNYSYQGQPLQAEAQYTLATNIDPYFSEAFYNIACLKTGQQQSESAFTYLEKALQAGFKDIDLIKTDSDLATLRALPEWQALMKKYFPDQPKE
ncbi:MAG: hypothetical protein IPJ06_14375 [Saprospiraceae bacterium]|nr:hypothetical protein [Saprospiraceae bacterium]